MSIKLELKNFRCHKDKTFSFEPQGLALLEGKSGQGKSTILESIYFALYGDIKKPYTFGTTTCSVKLVINGLNITRTCRPNRLVVVQENTTYTDTAAQHVINDVFMNKHEFLASSYIKQKSNSSIISMTPTEQVNFIKNIAFNTDVNTKIKMSIKELIKEAKLDSAKLDTEIKISEKQTEELKKGKNFNIKTDPIPEKNKFQQEHSKLKQAIEKAKILKNQKEKELQKNQKIKNNYSKDIKEKQRLEEDLEKLRESILKIKDTPQEESLELLEEELEEMTNKYNSILEYNFYLEEKQKYEEDALEYFGDLDDEYQELLNQQPDENYYNEILKQNEQYILKKNLQEKVDDLISKFSKKLNKKINPKQLLTYMMKFQKIYTCPCCSKNLILENDMLVKTAKKSLENSQDFTKEIDLLRKYTEIKDAKNCEKEIFQYKTNQKRISELEEILEDRILPKNLSEQYDKLQEINQKDFDHEDTDLLNQQIQEKQQYLEEQWKIKSNKHLLEKEFELKSKRLMELSEIEIVDIDTLSQELLKISDTIVSLQEKNNLYNKRLSQQKEYENFVKHQQDVKKWNEKLKEAQTKKQHLDKKIVDLTILRDRSNEAEILALDSIVENINTHAKFYLDQMFTIDPIVVRIENHKQTAKDIKCKLNTFIQYKGSEYDNVDQLSGGERQKCELAFELAVNTIMNSRILMLDECINNLDADVNTEIVQLLSDYAKEQNKLVIVVSHECVNGLFDITYKA